MKQMMLLPIFGLLFTSGIAQTPEIAIQKVQQLYNPEKIYLHYDKSTYIAGETIWFKAYLMEGFLPATRSTVLAVELLNDSGKLVDKKILPVVGSAAIGEFTLSKALPGGSYRIKAFTRNLMNLDYEHFYYQQVNISNAVKNDVAPVTDPPAHYVYFFPEGGNLVGNVKNTVAFKCTDKFGRPGKIEGKITGTGGKVEAIFQSTHDGMGTFVFTPKVGETYTADCIVNGTVKKETTLPVALQQGVVLNISQSNNKKYFSLDAATVMNESYWPDYILGVQENTVVFKVPAGAKYLKGEIPTGQLLTGILQITVFNKQHKPLAERLVFINSGDYVPSGNFKADRVSLESRAKNAFSFQLQDTIPGTFSVSVTSTETTLQPTENIVSRFLLTSEIRGKVHNPAYYFESNDEQHQQNLDLVMLTNGWRRYTWNEIFSGRFYPMTLKDPGLVSIKGQALHPSSGKPLAETDLTIFTKTKDGLTNLSAIQTDPEGFFEMQGMTFEDTAKFSFKKLGTGNSTVKINLLTPGISHMLYSLNTPLPALVPAIPMEKQGPALAEDRSLSRSTRPDGILLDEVKLKAKVKTEREKYEKEYVSGRLGSMATKTIDLLENPPRYSQRIFDYLGSNLTGVNISGGPSDYSIVYRQTRSMMGGPIQMTIYVDEFQVDPRMIASMNMSEVAMVKLYTNSAITGPGGAIAIYTKRGAGLGPANNVPLQEFQVEGFSPTKEFFSPDYGAGTDADILTDARTTLYWNPYLVSNTSDRSVSFSFYNSDKAKKFKIVLEGILGDGKLLHIEKVVE
jgi:hypothetical protein